MIIMVFILFLFIESSKEYKNEYSSKLEALKKSFQSQLNAIKTSKVEPTSDDKFSIEASPPVTGSDVKRKIWLSLKRGKLFMK